MLKPKYPLIYIGCNIVAILALAIGGQDLDWIILLLVFLSFSFSVVWLTASIFVTGLSSAKKMLGSRFAGTFLESYFPQKATLPAVNYMAETGVSREDYASAIEEAEEYLDSLLRSSKILAHATMKQRISQLHQQAIELYQQFVKKPSRYSLVKRNNAYLKEAVELIDDYTDIVNSRRTSPQMDASFSALEKFLGQLTHTMEQEIRDLEQNKIQNLATRVEAFEDVLKMERK